MLWRMELTALVKYASILEDKISIQNDLDKVKKRSERPDSYSIATQAIALNQE